MTHCVPKKKKMFPNFAKYQQLELSADLLKKKNYLQRENLI